MEEARDNHWTSAIKQAILVKKIVFELSKPGVDSLVPSVLHTNFFKHPGKHRI